MVTMNEMDQFVWLVLRMRNLQAIAADPDRQTLDQWRTLQEVESQVDQFCNHYVLPEPPILFVEGGAL